MRDYIDIVIIVLIAMMAFWIGVEIVQRLDWIATAIYELGLKL